MDILTGLAGLVIGAVTAWQLIQWRSDAEIARLRAQLEQMAAWVAGCQQGREDILSLAREMAQKETWHASDAGVPR
ncbi:MAG TPA: hypothetical protein VH589_03380, partial [Trebonia sp.]